MKAVILWAGMGRRISSEYNGLHKALIPINGQPLMKYILSNVLRAGITSIVPVLGYQADDMLCQIGKYCDEITVTPIVNPDYDKTNNLCSLIKAREVLDGDDFVVINGDMIFDYTILRDIADFRGTCIGTDAGEYPDEKDSPRLVIKNDRILDLGRHLHMPDAQGYAIGIYGFSADYSHRYFELAEAMALKNPNAGYHDPLRDDFTNISIKPIYTNGRLWMDVDEATDVPKAELMIKELAM